MKGPLGPFTDALTRRVHSAHPPMDDLGYAPGWVPSTPDNTRPASMLHIHVPSHLGYDSADLNARRGRHPPPRSSAGMRTTLMGLYMPPARGRDDVRRSRRPSVPGRSIPHRGNCRAMSVSCSRRSRAPVTRGSTPRRRLGARERSQEK